MTDRKGKNSVSGTDDMVVHLPKRRTPKSASEQRAEEFELKIAGHFREQNDILRELNRSLSDKVQRLTTGVERLVDEMHGVRTGKKSEAFARVAGIDASPDLPTVAAEAALIYTLTASDIGRELGFSASQIGTLLGKRGLNWAGNGDYQEIGRNAKPSVTKFWHREIPAKLRSVLDRGEPEACGIKDKTVLAMFRKWEQRKKAEELLDAVNTSAPPH